MKKLTMMVSILAVLTSCLAAEKTASTKEAGKTAAIKALVGSTEKAEAPAIPTPVLSKPNTGELSQGYRGTSLPIPGHQLVFIEKGDRVDVMVAFEAQMADKRKEKVTATISQNVPVIDVFRPAKIDDIGTIQLLLNPEEAQYVALSSAQGAIYIVARGEGDEAMHSMEMASFHKLFK